MAKIFFEATEEEETLFYNTLNLYPKAKKIIDNLDIVMVVYKNTNNNDWYGLYNFNNIIIKRNTDIETQRLSILHELHHLVQANTGFNMDNSLPYNERQHEIEAYEVSQRIYGSWLIMNRITDNG